MATSRVARRTRKRPTPRSGAARTPGARAGPARRGGRPPTVAPGPDPARRPRARAPGAARGKRYLIGMTGASGSRFGVDFVRRCPGEKYLVMSDWARQVMQVETGLKASDLAPHAKRVFADTDLAAPFASGSNRFDAFVVVPCSVSTLAKIAAGIADTLITRAAAVALKERMRLVLCVRETPLSTVALEAALRLSRDGVVIMPVSPPFYRNPHDLDAVVAAFTDKVLALLGEGGGRGWREEALE